MRTRCSGSTGLGRGSIESPEWGAQTRIFPPVCVRCRGRCVASCSVGTRPSAPARRGAFAAPGASPRRAAGLGGKGTRARGLARALGKPERLTNACRCGMFPGTARWRRPNRPCAEPRALRVAWLRSLSLSFPRSAGASRPAPRRASSPWPSARASPQPCCCRWTGARPPSG
jgi:hypothetical protein